MARVTIADCADRIPNQFTLIETASKRARQLAAGQDALVEWGNDKCTVVALREIAEGLIDESILIEVKAEESAADDIFGTAANEDEPMTTEVTDSSTNAEPLEETDVAPSSPPEEEPVTKEG